MRDVKCILDPSTPPRAPGKRSWSCRCRRPDSCQQLPSSEAAQRSGPKRCPSNHFPPSQPCPFGIFSTFSPGPARPGGRPPTEWTTLEQSYLFCAFSRRSPAVGSVGGARLTRYRRRRAGARAPRRAAGSACGRLRPHLEPIFQHHTERELWMVLLLSSGERSGEGVEQKPPPPPLPLTLR